MLEISGIKKSYKRKNVLLDVSFQAEPGSCIGIIGGNGTGKTTLLSILAGVRRAEAGSVFFHGEEVTKNTSFYSSKVAYVPQENPLIEELTVGDNLKLWHKDFKNVMKKGSDDEPFVLLGLQPVLSFPAGKLSGGMKKRLSIACALSNHAPVLILDEPGAALDLVCKEEIRNYLARYRKEGGIVILTSHEMEELSICDQMYALRQGKLNRIATGLSAKELMTWLI